MDALLWLCLMAFVMSFVVGIGFTLTLSMAVAAPALAERRKREAEAFAVVRDELGGAGSGQAITATVDGRALRVEVQVRKRGRSHIAFWVAGLPKLTVLSEGLIFGVSDRKVGDPAFDVAFRLSGDAGALGVLDADTRRLLLAHRHAFSLSDGVLEVRDERLVTSAEPLRAGVTLARTLAAAVAADDEELVAKLERVAQGDPLPAVRLTMARVLAERHPDRVAPVAEALLGDPDPSLRVWAAAQLGKDEVLLAVLNDPTAPVEVRIAAIDALSGAALVTAAGWVARADAPRFWEAVAKRADGPGADAVATALLPAAPRVGAVGEGATTDARLRHLLAARALASAWGRAPAGAPALFGLLAIDDEAVHLRALAGLGAVGAVSDVPALRRYASEASGARAAAAERAVAAIQARADGSRGELALADVEGGELALAQVAGLAGPPLAAARAPEGDG